MSFPRATQLAHQWIAERLKPGDRAVDATAGNGHDTVFLAKQVGDSGKVFAFDLQPEAILATRELAESVGVLFQVETLQLGHETMSEALTALDGKIQAVMFNLGYLPGGDKAVITQADTTILALDQALGLLNKGGVISVVLYTGHEGGSEEASAVIDFCRNLNPKNFRAVRYGAINFDQPPPEVIGIEKL